MEDLGLEGRDKINAITKRDHERKQDLQKRKDHKDQVGADNEKLDYFNEVFASKLSAIEGLVAQSSDMNQVDLPEHFNNISRDILTLQKYVATSNIFLRTYDIKKCQEKLQEMTIKMKELENDLLPKKKFGFKSRAKKKPTCEKIPKDEVDFQKGQDIIDKILTKAFCGFSNKANEKLSISGEEIYRKDVSAENLENCDVKFEGSPSTLHLNHLKGCRVFTGPVTTSIFADNCDNCTLVIACQQLRLHSSKNVKIYLHVTSRAIMEDCSEIGIAPFNWNYDGLEEDFKSSGLEVSTNNWKCIDDFNWLNVERQSPNWFIIDEQSRVTVWD